MTTRAIPVTRMDRIFNGPLQYRHHRRQAAALADRPAG